MHDVHQLHWYWVYIKYFDCAGMQCMIGERETFQRADTTSALDAAVENCVILATSPGKDKSSARLGAPAWVWMG